MQTFTLVVTKTSVAGDDPERVTAAARAMSQALRDAAEAVQNAYPDVRVCADEVVLTEAAVRADVLAKPRDPQESAA